MQNKLVVGTILFILSLMFLIGLHLKRTHNSDKYLEYDPIRSSILSTDTLIDTLDALDFPHRLPDKNIKKQVIITPANSSIISQKGYILIPKSDCTELGTRYLAYKWALYKRMGYNPATKIYEGQLIPKGTVLIVCGYTFKFENGIAFIRGCTINYVEKVKNCVKIRL